MNDVTKAIKKAYRPFDVVSCGGYVGFIKEVNINPCQPDIANQLSYSIVWLTDKEKTYHCAWFSHEELEWYGNIFEAIAGEMCHAFGRGRGYIPELLWGKAND